ncbi:DUF1003 domain-containing protein [Methylosarcina fibrata]|uniref:DUF1003 domain-containing protein n=1 Tax=Methylosarcina fibrata TaxID=105972 RepID=UPI00035FFC21|nr:DUF1003 domain-containing protein [Methylosarcina fibrata]
MNAAVSMSRNGVPERSAGIAVCPCCGGENAEHAAFCGNPYFITLPLVWFILWIVQNPELSSPINRFDEYPYSLPGIMLSIEAILIAGFVWISRNGQTACSEKRAETDGEVIVRTCRKLVELERHLERLSNINPQGD